MLKAIAIDVGGTKTLGAVIDSEGNKLKEYRTSTNPQQGRESLLESITKVVEELRKSTDVDVVSIGSAGRINYKTGEVFYSTSNLPEWSGVKLREIFEEKFQLPVVIDNDVNVAGLGEEWLGNAQGRQSYVCLTLGTGIAAAIKLDGTFVRGSHWSAGEIGHMTLYPNGRQCNCGLKGCFEQYCSGTALYKKYNDYNKDYLTSGKEFFEKISLKDETALFILNEFIVDLSTAIISMANIYDPEVFIIGGGLIETKELWWNQLMERIEQSELSKNIFIPKVIPAKLSNEAGIYGAALLGFHYLKNLKM